MGAFLSFIEIIHKCKPNLISIIAVVHQELRANVERAHKTIDDEFYQNPYRIWKTPFEWLDYYNFKRIHLSINGLTPQEKLLQCVTLDC